MKRNTRKLLAIVMAFALVMSFAAVSAFAEDSLTFTKEFTADSTATLPEIEFEFTIAPGTPVAASATSVEILEGPVTATAPSVGTASFDSDSPTTADTNDATKKIATADVEVDFSDVVFPGPGVYRYVLTETQSNLDYIHNDDNAIRYIDVFVVNENDELVIDSFAMRNVATNIDPTTGEYVENADDKDDGYTNDFLTNDLEFSKAITGNQSDKNKQFAFTLSLSDVVPGTYNVVVSRADVVDADESNVEGSDTVYTLTVGADGAFEGKFYLADGDTVAISDLPAGYTYTLTEDPEDYISTENLDGYADPTSDEGVTEDVKTGFTNTREGITPTGVILTVAPFAIGLLLFGAIVLYMISKRRRATY